MVKKIILIRSNSNIDVIFFIDADTPADHSEISGPGGAVLSSPLVDVSIFPSLFDLNVREETYPVRCLVTSHSFTVLPMRGLPIAKSILENKKKHKQQRV